MLVELLECTIQGGECAKGGHVPKPLKMAMALRFVSATNESTNPQASQQLRMDSDEEAVLDNAGVDAMAMEQKSPPGRDSLSCPDERMFMPAWKSNDAQFSHQLLFSQGKRILAVLIKEAFLGKFLDHKSAFFLKRKKQPSNWKVEWS